MKNETSNYYILRKILRKINIMIYLRKGKPCFRENTMRVNEENYSLENESYGKCVFLGQFGEKGNFSM